MVDGIVAVIGPTCLEEAQAAVPILANAGLVIISPSTGQGLSYPGFYRMIDPGMDSSTAAKYAIEKLGASKAIIIQDGKNDSSEQAAMFRNYFQDATGAASQNIQIVRPDDLQQTLAGIEKNPPDVIFLSTSPVLAGNIVEQIRSVPTLESIPILGSEDIFSSDFLQSAGTAAQGVYLTASDMASFSKNYSGFISSYQTRYGEYPITSGQAYAYDATNLLIHAILHSAVLDRNGNLYIPRLGLRQALENIRNFSGVSGTLSCNELGDCSDTNPSSLHAAIYQITDPNPDHWNPGVDPKRIYP